MVDISMCSDYECSLRNKCYRYLAVPCEFQSYLSTCRVGKECDYFYKIYKQNTRDLNDVDMLHAVSIR